jgi:hypothetical protein
LAPAFEAYHTGEYRAAIGFAMRVNIPGYFWVPLTTAAARWDSWVTSTPSRSC